MMNNRLLKFLIRELDKPKFILGLVMSLAATSFALLLPQFIGKLLDESVLKTFIGSPVALIGFIGVFVTVYAAQAFSNYMIGLCGSKSLNNVQKYVYSSLLRTSVKDLEQYQSGDLSSRLTNDMSVALNFITVVLPNLLLNTVVIAGSLYFLIKISLSMTLMSLLILPFLFFVIVPINNKLEDHYTGYQESLGEISSRISNKFTNIRLLKSFNGEPTERKAMSGSFDSLTKSFQRIIGLSAVQTTLVSSLMMGFIIVMLVVAGMEVSKGNMTMSTLMTFILYMMQIIEPVTNISNSMTELTEFNSVSNRLVELLELDKERGEEQDEEVQGTGIVMNGISFGYGEENVLNNLSLTIPEGQHVAIVGPSGSGKTTLFSLLMKFYQDYQGDILIGDKKLSDLSEEQMRNMIAYIPQDNKLFYGTIRDNLLYGKNSSVSDERIDEVLQELGLTKLVDSLEKGLDTEITDSGTGLSEGQKQRFNIARALLLDHPIYLLDEVTASLDSVTEKIISKAIDKLTVGKTRLTIAHRLHTVKEADSIIVLDKNGNISDQGTHSQLTKRNNLYRELLSGLQAA